MRFQHGHKINLGKKYSKARDGYRICSKCKEEKILIEFYKSNAMPLNRGYVCMPCQRSLVKGNIIKYNDEYRAYMRQYMKSYYLKSRPKQLARASVARAIKKGILQKEPCEVCGFLIVDAHHGDYSQPLIVNWFCRPHHAEMHRLQRANL